MIKLSSKNIKDYLESTFTNYKVVGYHSQEFTINSVFVKDTGYHLSINMQTGLWQDFRAKKKGNIIGLVAAVEKISFREAEARLRRKYLRSMESLEENIKSLLEPPQDDYNRLFISNNKDFSSLNIKEYTNNIKDTNNNILKNKAIKLLKNKGLYNLNHLFLIGDKPGPLFGRLIIPFILEDKVIYYQARTLFNDKIKYLNPSSKDCGVKSSDILYPYNTQKDYLFIVEGPLDAITLQSIGVNATSLQGSSISQEQLRVLKIDKHMKFVLSMDNDKPGRVAEASLVPKLLKVGIEPERILTCHPSLEYKDWNDMFTLEGKESVLLQIKKTKKYDSMDLVYSTIKGNSSE